MQQKSKKIQLRGCIPEFKRQPQNFQHEELDHNTEECNDSDRDANDGNNNNDTIKEEGGDHNVVDIDIMKGEISGEYLSREPSPFEPTMTSREDSETFQPTMTSREDSEFQYDSIKIEDDHDEDDVFVASPPTSSMPLFAQSAPPQVLLTPHPNTNNNSNSIVLNNSVPPHPHTESNYPPPNNIAPTNIPPNNSIANNNNIAPKRATWDKPHTCEVCHKSFSRPYHLRDHMNVHTGAKPFACDYCDARFFKSDDLNRHVRRHNNIEHSCAQCGKVFGSKGALKSHVVTHR